MSPAHPAIPTSPSITCLYCLARWILYHSRPVLSAGSVQPGRRCGVHTHTSCTDMDSIISSCTEYQECPDRPADAADADAHVHPRRSGYRGPASTPSHLAPSLASQPVGLLNARGRSRWSRLASAGFGESLYVHTHYGFRLGWARLELS
jgi:hypothetical protein